MTYVTLEELRKLDLAGFKECLKDKRFDSASTKGRRDAVDEDAAYFGVLDPFEQDYIKCILQ